MACHKLNAIQMQLSGSYREEGLLPHSTGQDLSLLWPFVFLPYCLAVRQIRANPSMSHTSRGTAVMFRGGSKGRRVLPRTAEQQTARVALWLMSLLESPDVQDLGLRFCRWFMGMLGTDHMKAKFLSG